MQAPITPSVVAQRVPRMRAYTRPARALALPHASARREGLDTCSLPRQDGLCRRGVTRHRAPANGCFSKRPQGK
eukprot:3874485-Alexandrium_andersonii.AAC.1